MRGLLPKQLMSRAAVMPEEQIEYQDPHHYCEKEIGKPIWSYTIHTMASSIVCARGNLGKAEMNSK